MFKDEKDEFVGHSKYYVAIDNKDMFKGISRGIILNSGSGGSRTSGREQQPRRMRVAGS